jgi:hypothetical protein
MSRRRAEIESLCLRDPIIGAALEHERRGGCSYEEALELAVVTYSQEMKTLKAKLLALVSGSPGGPAPYCSMCLDSPDCGHCYACRNVARRRASHPGSDDPTPGGKALDRLRELLAR